jgi:transposase
VKAAPEPHEAVRATAAHEAVQPGTRRRFTAAEKLRLVKAAAVAIASGERGALEALLRREGIYSSHLSTWRRQLAAGGEAGLTSRTPGRKPKLDAKGRELVAVTKENENLKRKLRIANALIDLQKKAHELLGLTLPEAPEELS